MRILGLDVGGANLKLADGLGLAICEPFALWKEPASLAERLVRLLARAGCFEGLALTMTGELADCFEDKAAGVASIVAAAEAAARGVRLWVYLVDGSFADPASALAQPRLAAASNWRALAAYVGRYAAGGRALLLDIGSTTCDLVPLRDGQPIPAGLDDTSRLLCGELVYSGVERSPLCAVVGELPYRGQPCPVAAEWFATTRDAYLVTGDLPECPDDRDTADGRPATVAAAVARLGRMVCADRSAFDREDALSAAEAVATAQLDRLRGAWSQATRRLEGAPVQLVVSGHGDFLAARLLAAVGSPAAVVWLTRSIGAGPARCATAHALAVLAREAFTDG